MSKIAKTTLLVMVLTIFSKFLGLFREQVLAATYGMGMHTDVYVTAMKIPTILFIYTAVVTVAIWGTSCYTGSSSKNLFEKYLKIM